MAALAEQGKLPAAGKAPAKGERRSPAAPVPAVVVAQPARGQPTATSQNAALPAREAKAPGALSNPYLRPLRQAITQQLAEEKAQDKAPAPLPPELRSLPARAKSSEGMAGAVASERITPAAFIRLHAAESADAPKTTKPTPLMRVPLDR